MEKFDLRRIAFRPRGRAIGLVAASLLLGVGCGLVFVHRRPATPPPLDPAAVAALQNAAFTQAEAQPGFARPETVPVKLERGETLEGAVQRAGVAPAEAQRAVEMLSRAMDTVHIKAGLLIQAAIARPRAANPSQGAGEARLIGLSLRTGPASALTI